MHKNVSIDAYTVPDNTKNIMHRALTSTKNPSSAADSKMELQNMAAAQIAMRRKSVKRPHYDIVTHVPLEKTSVDKYELFNSSMDKRVNPARNYVISDFQHRNNGHKFHKEYAAGIKASPGIYSQKMGQFNHAAATLTDTKHIIRSTRFAPAQAWHNK
jgi:hypothetical protein